MLPISPKGEPSEGLGMATRMGQPPPRATHGPKRERKRALRDVYAMEPVAPKYNPWSSYSITFDRRDHPTSIRHDGSAALGLDPIIDGFHLTRVLMDSASSLNLLYQDTVRKMGIDPSRSSPPKPPLKA